MCDPCKCFKDEHMNNSQRHTERICYKTMDSIWRNIPQYRHKVATQANPIGATTLQLGEDIRKIALNTQISMPELVSICSRNRPLGVLDDDWKRFLASTCRDCSWSGGQQKREPMKSAKLSTSRQVYPYQDNIRTVKDILIEESLSMSYLSPSVSSAQFAGRFELPDVNCDHSNTETTSLWSLNTESITWSEPQYLSARSLQEFSIANKFGTSSDMLLKSYCTKFSLGDLRSNCYEQCCNENKISTTGNSNITDIRSKIVD